MGQTQQELRRGRPNPPTPAAKDGPRAASGLGSPVFVIGTHRSGTTFLADALAQHPDVDYWPEPRQVWSWRNNLRPDDRLTAADATARIKAHIRGTFGRHLEASGRSRFLEKTPSNCLRLPFIREIFPDALFVHIYRDGRAVVSSTRIVTRTRVPEWRFYRSRVLGTPVWEWPAYLPRAWRTLGRRLLGRDMRFWGPQPPGWRRWVKKDPQLVVLARQWRGTLEPVLEFGGEMPSSQWLDLRYEDLIRAPAEHARRILEFTGLGQSPEVEEFLTAESDPSRIDGWRSRFEEGELEQIRPILEPTLTRLGYHW